MVPHFCSPSAFLEPSWLQAPIFNASGLVFASLGCLPGLSWEGFGVYLGPLLGLAGHILAVFSALWWLFSSLLWLSSIF